MKKYEEIYKYFDRVLFWDYDNIDIKKHSRFIIERIIEYGDFKDIENLQKLYTKRQIIETIKESRNISRKTANYWAIKYNLDERDIKCLRK
ncbi:MAG: hypothetical protein AB7T10_07285 [bacterium]